MSSRSISLDTVLVVGITPAHKIHDYSVSIPRDDQPSRLYLVSTPAHRDYPTTLIKPEEAATVELGSSDISNERTLPKYTRSGAGTSGHCFVRATAGENQDFIDMVAISTAIGLAEAGADVAGVAQREMSKTRAFVDKSGRRCVGITRLLACEWAKHAVNARYGP